MKKLIIAALVLLMAASMSGCAGKTEAGFSKEDLYLNISGKEYRCDTNIEQVIAVLGSTYEYSEGKSCAYDGLDKTFIYDTAEFYTYPAAEGDYINEIFTSSAEVTTSRGVFVGSTKEDVLAAYGDDYEDTGYLLMYKIPAAEEGLDSASLCFMLEDDVVTSLWITAEQPAGA